MDTNVLLSALIRPAKSRALLCCSKINLYAPEQILEETLAHRDEIILKSGVSDVDFSKLMEFLSSRIIVMNNKEFKHMLKPAMKLIGHVEDAPFIALCLYKNIPLWSDDKALKKQSSVGVFSTSELIKEVNL